MVKIQESIFFIKDKLLDDETLRVRVVCFFFTVKNSKVRLLVGGSNPNRRDFLCVDVLFFGDVDDLIASILEQDQELVEGADFDRLGAGDFCADISGLGIVAHFHSLFGDLPPVEFFDSFNLGAARKQIPMLFQQPFEILDREFLDIFKVLFDLEQLFLKRRDIFLVFFDVEAGNAADRDCEEPVAVFPAGNPGELLVEGLQAVFYGRMDLHSRSFYKGGFR
jgi:hypothetical protein